MRKASAVAFDGNLNRRCSMPLCLEAAARLFHPTQVHLPFRKKAKGLAIAKKAKLTTEVPFKS